MSRSRPRDVSMPGATGHEARAASLRSSLLFGVLFFGCTPAAMQATCGCSKGSIGSAGAGPRALSTWVWEHEHVIDEARRRDLLSFAQEHGVHAIYVHLSERYDEPDAFVALRSLVARAHAHDIAIAWVAGSPHWARSDEAHAVERVIRRAAALNKRLRAADRPAIRRVIFDVEPYLLSAWERSESAVTRHFVAFLDRARREGHAHGFEVWQTIPFWFSKRRFESVALDRVVLSKSDGVVLMAYRDRVHDVLEVAARTLERAGELGRPLILAVETHCISPSHVTLCGRDSGGLAAALRALSVALTRHPTTEALAVHDYVAWRRLAGDERSTP